MTQTLTVGCDLFLDLKLYHVPKEYLNNLRRDQPEVEILPVNLRNGQPSPPPDLEIYWGNRITPEIISSLPRLKWIHFGSVGVNRAQTKDVVERKILVTNSKDVMTAAVASSALAMMLALARGLHRCWKLRQEGNLSRESYDCYFDNTHELEGQVCLIVGFGQIGVRLAKVCTALGMRVDAVGRTSISAKEISGRRFSLAQLKQAVREADYIVNLLPLTPLTLKVFDREIFLAMRKNAFFINVGRGETVCEADLVQALQDQTIAGAGLDVFEKEPLSADSPLLRLSEVIITPHIAGLTNRYWERECALFKENVRRYKRGEKLLNLINMEKGY